MGQNVFNSFSTKEIICNEVPAGPKFGARVLSNTSFYLLPQSAWQLLEHCPRLDKLGGGFLDKIQVENRRSVEKVHLQYTEKICVMALFPQGTGTQTSKYLR